MCIVVASITAEVVKEFPHISLLRVGVTLLQFYPMNIRYPPKSNVHALVKLEVDLSSKIGVDGEGINYKKD